MTASTITITSITLSLAILGVALAQSIEWAKAWAGRDNHER